MFKITPKVVEMYINGNTFRFNGESWVYSIIHEGKSKKYVINSFVLNRKLQEVLKPEKTNKILVKLNEKGRIDFEVV